MKMLKCLLTDSDVLLFIMDTIKNRFPEVPAAMCAMLTIFIPYVNILSKKKNLMIKHGRRQKPYISSASVANASSYFLEYRLEYRLKSANGEI